MKERKSGKAKSGGWKRRFETSAFFRHIVKAEAKLSQRWNAISVKRVAVDLSPNQDGSEMRTIDKKRPIGLFLSLGLALLVFACCFIPLNYRAVFWNPTSFWTAIRALFTPNPLRTKTWEGWWAYSWKEFTTEFAHLFYVCFLGTVLGALIAIPVYYLCAHNVTRSPWIHQPVRIFNDFLRTIPIFLIGLLISQIFSTGNSINSVLTIAVFTLGVMYQMMYEYIETLEMSPFEGIRSCGGNNLQCVNLGLHPEVKPMFFAYFIYSLEINIRASVILSYVGFGGYVKTLQNNIDTGYYDWAGAMLIPLFLVVVILQFASNTLARKLR